MSYCIGEETNDPPYGGAEGAGDANCGYDMGGEPLVMDWADITGDVIYEKVKSASRQMKCNKIKSRYHLSFS